MIECNADPDKLADLKSAMEKNIRSTRKNANTSECLIGNNRFQIYFYDAKDRKEESYNNNTPVIFYTCTNCVFAIWTLDELLQFVSHFPLLYQPQYADIENNLIRKNLSLFFDILIRVRQRAEVFIDVLLNFIDINEPDSSVDTEFLEILLILNLKINLIHTMYDKKNDDTQPSDDNIDDEYQTDMPDEDNNEIDGTVDPFDQLSDDYLESTLEKNIGSDDVVIRMILETMNSIQHFILINCKFSPLYSKKPFYGFTMAESDSKKVDIIKFLRDIRPMRLESLDKICNIEQMLFLKFISSCIQGVELNTGHGKFSIEYIYPQIEKLYDLKLVYWYQELIFKIIMKLLFRLIQQHVIQCESLSNDILNNFKYVQSEILSVYTHLPANLMNSFSKFILYQDSSNANSMKDAIDEYLKSLNYITVDYARFTLDVLVSQIKSVDNGFECFVRLFGFLRRKFNLYYIPFRTGTIEIKSFLQKLHISVYGERSSSKEAQQLRADESKRKALNSVKCNYVISLYHYCFEAIIAINSALTGYPAYDTEQCFTEAGNMLSFVKQTMIDLINKSWDLPLFRVLYNVVPLLETYLPAYLEEDCAENLKRLVYVIMAELNKCGIEFCKPPDYNFLLFNNINFDKIGKLSTRVNKDIKTSVGILQSDDIKHEYLSLNNLYKAFDDKYEDFALYDTIISIKWKGEELSFTNVYKYIKSGIFSASYLYAFYDFCSKFPLAVIFYELRYINYECKSITLSSDDCDQISTIYNRESLPLKFPDVFTKIIKDIFQYSIYVKNFCCNKMSVHVNQKKYEDKIIEYFFTFGISFNFNNLKPAVNKPLPVIKYEKPIFKFNMFNQSWKETPKPRPKVPIVPITIYTKNLGNVNDVLQFISFVKQQFDNHNAFEEYSSVNSVSLTSNTYLTAVWNLINHQSSTPTWYLFG